jgi:hypothetical protein
MEEQFYADRTYLRQLLQAHPRWTVRQLMDATGRSRSWVKKWRQRLSHAPPEDETVLQGLSRARHTPPERIHPEVVDRILEIRDHPPDHLQRIPGPKAILYYLHRDAALRASGWHVPTSTSTLWRILDAHGRIAREPIREHVPVERPEPMRSWQMDFKDVSSVPADPEGKQQHVVETLNVVDVGTSIVVEAVVRDDFTNETVRWALTHIFLTHGLPERITFDRDPRFVGSWSGRDFPSAVMRFLLCLGLDAKVCPAQRPDLNAFVERYHRSYGEECLDIYRPQDQTQADEVTQRYRQHFNWERPNQALTCHNQPPCVAFPTLPQLPALPEWVDPDRWLAAIDGRRYRRRVTSRGTIRLDNRSYYVKQALAGQYVTVRVDAAQRQLVIEHDKRPIKCIPIKGLYNEILSFETYFEAIREEARLDWRRMLHERQRRVAM